MGPYDYLLSHPGKNIRRQLIEAFKCWLLVPPPKAWRSSTMWSLCYIQLLYSSAVSYLLREPVRVLHTYEWSPFIFLECSMTLATTRFEIWFFQLFKSTCARRIDGSPFANIFLFSPHRVDDIQDNTLLRHGIPTAHHIFGTAQTINSANYVYFLALQEIQKLNNLAAINVFTEELLNLHRGQGKDLYWRDTLTCPTEDEYLDMVGDKTGGLFRLVVKLMQAGSPTNKDRVDLVNVMGLIFQICDDYLNLCDMTYGKNKGLYEDLTEWKFSFPIIHSIRSNPSSHRLISILK
ncbi:terpenoid synthase [Penicillium malachiteum]|uniref:Terpenoid synthase n=1 Tax=Penicillium malachiteum TaxID=1324776 RepID=A0AAD6MW23_9EURO|nr:terpenoid synthase [Penicillium malachiteum]